MTGLYRYTKDHEIQRKLRKVSAFVFIERILKKHFAAFKNQWFLKQLGDHVFDIHAERARKSFYQLWAIAYKNELKIKTLKGTLKRKITLKSFNQWLYFH